MIEGHLIIIGAMKAGTTSLFEALAPHPNLIRARLKEPHYFTGNRWRGPEGYDALFPTPPEDRPVLTLDGSTSCAKMHVKSIAGRIAQLTRPVHLVYMLRDPLARAISHARHNVAAGRQTAEALAALPLRGLVAPSRYSHCIESYQAAGLGDRLLLLDFDTLCRDPAQVVAAVCRHAGIAPIEVPPSVHANASPLPPDTTSGLDVAALRRALKGERRRMIQRHGFEPARNWTNLGKPA